MDCWGAMTWLCFDAVCRIAKASASFTYEIQASKLTFFAWLLAVILYWTAPSSSCPLYFFY